MYASLYGATFKCDKDKALLKRIMAWMRKHEYPVWSVTGCLSDIWAGVNGRIIRIEVKVGKEKLRRAQMEERLQNEPDGYLGQYIFVHNFKEFLEQIAPLHNLRNHKGR
ncbi:MAG: hypothetical protein MdMp024_0984 [Bacteroidales bacterium]